MLLAALFPILATVLGTAMALGARRWLWVFEPVRSFALAAVTVTIAVHLMPEAVEAVGGWALLPLAGGLVLPSLLGWIAGALQGGRGGRDHASLAVELTFVGVLAHQIGDGLGLGVVTGPAHAGHTHWDLLIAIGAHTVPLAAVVAITFAQRDGRRAALWRAVLVAVTPLLGLAITRAGDSGLGDGAAPWLNAAVSGLLLHVLAHDLPSAHARSKGVRTAELLAIVAGVVVPLIAAGQHGGEAHGHAHGAGAGVAERIPAMLYQLAIAAAPALLAGVLLGAVINAAARRASVQWLAPGGGLGAALRGAVLGVPLPPCSCDIVPVGGELRGRGGGASFVTAFVLAAPQLGLGALLLTVALLGWKLALLRLVGAVVAAVVAALVVERVAGDRGGAPAPATLPAGPRSLAEGIDDLVAHDGAWIAVGLTVAAFIAGAAAPGTFGGPMDLPVLVVVAMLVTVSATAATPIAAMLAMAGMSPGTVMAGLLLGSTVNLTTVGFVRRSWGGAAAAAAVAAVLMIAVGVAVLVDAMGIGAAGLATEIGDGVAAQVAGVALLGLAAASLWRHGLAHWLAALRGSDHGHEHGAVGHCEHHQEEPAEIGHAHAHPHAHAHAHAHDHDHDHDHEGQGA